MRLICLGKCVAFIILLRSLTPISVFQTPWHSIITSVESLATSHHILANKIEVDVERPLRDYQTRNREMQAISTIQGNLAAVAKEVDSANKKASKLNTGKVSANKVANVTSDVEAANQQWESQAPYVFEQLQALDENRVNHLRDVLTQLETHEVDQVERNRASAESCLNVLLNIDTSDEISTFVARQSQGLPLAEDRPERQTPDMRGSRSVTTGSSSAAQIPPPEVASAATPSRSRVQDENMSDRPSPFSMSSRQTTRKGKPSGNVSQCTGI